MDPKQLAIEHFEKAVIGLAGAWLLFVGVGLFSKPAALQASDDLNTKLADIRTYMDSAKAEAAEAPAYTARLEEQVSPSGVPEATALPTWSMHRRPNFLFSTTPAAPKQSANHAAPVSISADASERGKITVTWSPSVNNKFVVVESYDVERRVGADGEWSSIGSVGGQDSQYEDTDVKSRTEYYYRVTSVADIERGHPVVRQEGITLANDQRHKVSDVTGPVQTKRDVYVVPITVQQVTMDDLVGNPNAKESAYVRVYKWDAESGKFEAQAFTVGIGQEIGELKKRRGKEYDFRTGATLVDVEIRSRTHKLGHEEPVQVVKYAFSDGSEEEANDKDLPEEIAGQ